MRIHLAAALALAAAGCTKPSGSPPVPQQAAAPAKAPDDKPAAAPAPPQKELPPEVVAKLKAAEDRMKKEARSFEAALAFADLSYDNGRFVEAVGVYQQAAERGRDTLALLDELAPKKPAKPLEPKAAGCLDAGAANVEANDAKARKARDGGDLAVAWTCAQKAAAPILLAQSRRASALFMVGNVDPALAEYEKILKRDPDMPEALFFAGALLVNRRTTTTADLGRAQKIWARFLEVAPKDHPRRGEVEKTLPEIDKALASAAQPTDDKDPAPRGAVPPGHSPMGGEPSKDGMPGGHPGAAAIADVEKALDEAEAALAKGDGSTAAKLYMGAMNERPNDARMQAGLAASQFLKGSAMAERVFSVAAIADPKAVDDLAGRLSKKGNPGLARTLLQRLAAVNPEYAEKAKLKDRK